MSKMTKQSSYTASSASTASPASLLSERGEELDDISRQRSLTDLESLELEREITRAAGERLPNGYFRELIRSRKKPKLVSLNNYNQ